MEKILHLRVRSRIGEHAIGLLSHLLLGVESALCGQFRQLRSGSGPQIERHALGYCKIIRLRAFQPQVQEPRRFQREQNHPGDRIAGFGRILELV